MKRPLRPARPDGPVSFRLSIAALAVALSLPAAANAAPPISAILGSELAAQAETGTIKGRLVWGGAEIPKVKMLEEKGNAKDASLRQGRSPSSTASSWSTRKPRGSPTG